MELFTKDTRFEATGILTREKYNLLMCATVFWGFLINTLMCAFHPTLFSSNSSFLIALLIYLALTIGGIIVMHNTTKPGVCLVGFTMLAVGIGLCLDDIASRYADQSLQNAFTMTVIVAVIMGCLASLKPEFFDKLGRVLFVSLLATFIAELVLTLIFKQSFLIFDYAILVIFSLYLGYDLHRSQQYPETPNNAIVCAADIYLDLVNIFLRLLRIFGNNK